MGKSPIPRRDLIDKATTLMNIFLNKNIILGVTGSIAAYKAAALASTLCQSGARVQVVMTPAATHFVGPLTFESITHLPVVQDVLALGRDSEIEHVALAQRADLLLIAPATANTIAKLALGFADDALSAIALDTRAPIVIAPAMETGMWENWATQENIDRLRARGMTIVEPGIGHLASGASGRGRLAEPGQILAAVRTVFARSGSLSGKRIIVTAGGTQEPIDPVRVITNRSSGKMGTALAQEAVDRGAHVCFIRTQPEIVPPIGAQVHDAGTSEQLRAAVLELVAGADALLMAAAPADFRVRSESEHKIKKENAEQLTLELVRNPDILAEIALILPRHTRKSTISLPPSPASAPPSAPTPRMRGRRWSAAGRRTPR